MDKDDLLQKLHALETLLENVVTSANSINSARLERAMSIRSTLQQASKGADSFLPDRNIQAEMQQVSGDLRQKFQESGQQAIAKFVEESNRQSSYFREARSLLSTIITDVEKDVSVSEPE